MPVCFSPAIIPGAGLALKVSEPAAAIPTCSFFESCSFSTGPKDFWLGAEYQITLSVPVHALGLARLQHTALANSADPERIAPRLRTPTSRYTYLW